MNFFKLNFADIYNLLYRLSNRINLFVPLSIVIGFAILLIIFLKFRKLINPLKKAKALRDRGNNVRALAYVDLFLEKNPLNKNAILLKADIERDLGLYPEAEGDYFRVIYTKTKGDGIDVSEIKKRLLEALYKQEKIYQTFELAKDILSLERTCAEALFYLSLIYMGQLYFKEADKILKRLTLNRPKMSEAFYIQAINFVQLRLYEDALASINRAIDLNENMIYHLIKSAICYFDGNYSLAKDELDKLPNSKEGYKLKKQFMFYLKLNAMVNYKLRYFDRAALVFKLAIGNLDKENLSRDKKSLKLGTGKEPVIYGENGKLKNIKQVAIKKGEITNPVEEYEKRMGLRKNISPEIEEYLRLKEVAIEEGKTKLIAKKNIHDPFQLLDIDGLTDKTGIYMSYGFALIKGGRYEDAVEFFKKMRKEHSEIIGLKRLIELIDEKIKDSETSEIDLEYLRKKSEMLMKKKKKRYELWEYIQEWERRIIRPFELFEISGYSTKKQLNPTILFKKDTKFSLDF